MIWLLPHPPRHLVVVAIFAVWSIASIHADHILTDSKCAPSSLFECPTAVCPSGISYVNNCLDCDGHLNTYFEKKSCFQRKLLNGKDNPSRGYLYRDIAGIVVWFLAAGVAVACGVGGGGIYVPLGIVLLAFAPKQSSGLSQASIFGATVGGLILNLRNKHPFTIMILGEFPRIGNDFAVSSIPTVDCPASDVSGDSAGAHYYTRPLIDYDMALFLAPMEMAGAVLGVLIQTILPNWLYLSMSSVILGFTAYKTYGKWWDTRQKETTATETTGVSSEVDSPELLTTETDETAFYRLYEAGNEDLLSSGTSADIVTSNCDRQSGIRSEPSLSATPNDHSDPESTEQDEIAGLIANDGDILATRDYLLQRDARQYPTEKLVLLLVLWIVLTLITFLKGGKGVESLVGITCADPWYGVLIAFQFVWTLGFAAYFARKLILDTQQKKSVGFPFHPTDVMWDFKSTRFYALVTFIAGTVAGLIGVGGGMLLGPLMLVMGIHPMVSTATTATMIVLTSSSVAILFVTSGLVPWTYAVTFFFVCCMGALVGKTVIDRYIRRTKKASLLVFLLATIISFATVGTVVIVLVRVAEANWCFAGFNKFCDVPNQDTDIVCKDEQLLLQDSFYNDVIQIHV
jgi:uncharacterized membrane protein YfcA